MELKNNVRNLLQGLLKWRLASTANRDLPIFMAHGAMDPVIPMQLAKLSKARMDTHGYKIDWHEYGMPHSVCADEIDDMAVFLKRVLTA